MKNKLIDLALIVVIFIFSLIVVIFIYSIAHYMQILEQHLPPSKNVQKYLTEKVDKNSGLYDPPEAASTVSHSQDASNNVSDTKLPNIETPRPQTHETPAIIASEEESQHIHDLIIWCQERGIKLVGITKNAHDLVYKGVAEEDILPIHDIPNLHEVAAGLHEIPDPLLTVMEGKTFYLSNLPGRGYTILGSWSEKSILAKIDRGIILEQLITKRQTIHEFAHILDYHGIQGTYGDPNIFWPDLRELRDAVFAVPFDYDRKRPAPPAGYMDIYSTANPAENFAQHFMYYILHGAEFRKKAQNDELLQKKYDFFKNNLFNDLEY